MLCIILDDLYFAPDEGRNISVGEVQSTLSKVVYGVDEHNINFRGIKGIFGPEGVQINKL
jgi:hypothetical protein